MVVRWCLVEGGRHLVVVRWCLVEGGRFVSDSAAVFSGRYFVRRRQRISVLRDRCGGL